MAQARVVRCAFLALIALSTLHSRCYADPVRVFWEPQARACLDETRVRREMRRVVGREVFVSAAPDVVLRSAVTASPPSVELTLSDAEGRALGQRRLKARSCSELTASATLALSLMLDFDDAELARRARDSEAAEADSGSEGSRTPPLGIDIALQALLRAGLAPRVTSGLGLSAGLALGSGWGVGATGSFWPSRRFLAADGVLRLSEWQVSVDACLPGIERGPFAVTGCGELRLSSLSASTSGFDVNTPQSAWIFLPGAFARFSAKRERMFVRLDLGANLTTSRPRFSLREASGTQALHHSPQVSFGAALSVGVRGW